MTMAALFPLLSLLFLHVLHPSSAFSNVPSRSTSCFRQVKPTNSRFPPIHSGTCRQWYRRIHPLAATDDINNDSPDANKVTATTNSTTNIQEAVNGEAAVSDEPKKNAFSRIFGGGKKFNKASLAKLGGSVLLSYGFVSNIFGITCVSCAWYIASRKTGLSPLAPGQWKGFVAVYAAFFAFLNVIRPARFALSIYISKYFDRVLEAIQNRFKCNKGASVGILVTLQVLFNFSYLFLGIAIASTLARVPIWAGRV